MFDENEEDLALLEQYENENDYYSDEEITSDLEDKIMSVVQYGSTPTTTATASATTTFQPHTEQKNTKPISKKRSVPMDNTSDMSSDSSYDDNSSQPELIELDNSSDDDFSDNLSTNGNEELPQVTRRIDLDLDTLNQQNDIESEFLDEEEKQLEHQVQDLIDQQITDNNHNRKRKILRVCTTCYLPGHTKYSCPMCPDCGYPKHDQCPGTMACRNCKRLGHIKRNCIYDYTNERCKHCRASDHISEYCPTLIHFYIDDSSTTPTINNEYELFCYYCGGEGHLGDDCSYAPASRDNYPTVFSSEILKNSKNYRDILTNTSARGSDHQSNKHHVIEISDDDDELGFNRSNNYNNNEGASRSHKRKHHKKERRDKKERKDKSREELRHYQRRGDSNKRFKSKYNGNNSNNEYRSGNNNWKALTQATIASSSTSASTSTSTSSSSLPRPSRSGYMDVNRNIITDFPRHEQHHALPQPNRTGYTNSGSRGNNLPQPNRSGSTTNKEVQNFSKSRYKGGYRRN